MDYTKLEQEIVDLLNKVRKDPQSILPKLKAMLPCFKDNYYKIPGTNMNIITNEGPAAVEDAIDFLAKQKPVNQFEESVGLHLAAKDHVLDIGKNGLVSHEGTDKTRMTHRIERYGEWSISIAENIGFDDADAEDIVFGMIIDDGNKSRGHRRNIFNNEFRNIGVACGPHKYYKHCTVLNFAVMYKDNDDIKVEKREELDFGYSESEKDDDEEVFRRKTTINYQPQGINESVDKEDSISFKKDSVMSKGETEPQSRKITGFEMPEGATVCKVKKFIKTVGNKRTIKVVRTFKMQDGSTQVFEEIDEEYL